MIVVSLPSELNTDSFDRPSPRSAVASGSEIMQTVDQSARIGPITALTPAPIAYAILTSLNGSEITSGKFLPQAPLGPLVSSLPTYVVDVGSKVPSAAAA